MTTITLNPIARTYKNNGQHLEQTFRYNLTGKIEKSRQPQSNRWMRPFQLFHQVRKGNSLQGNGHWRTPRNRQSNRICLHHRKPCCLHNEQNRIKRKLKLFRKWTPKAQKNGGSKKLRLGRETSKMLEWLTRQWATLFLHLQGVA